MIEAILMEALSPVLDVPVYCEVPADPPESFCVLERARGGRSNQLDDTSIAVQSYGGSLYKAARLNDRVKREMLEGAVWKHPAICRVRLNSDYNWTDPDTKRYRYQAVYDITYYEEE